MGESWGRVFIGTRLEKQVLAEFVACWSHMLAAGVRPRDAFGIISGRPAQWAANDLADRFLRSDCDSLLFIDSDAGFGVDTLSKLRDLEAGQGYDILSAFYCRRGNKPDAMLMRWDEGKQQYQTHAVTGALTCSSDAVGLHFCLVRRRVFEKLERPWFYYPRDYKSEDVVFCEDARRAGFRIGFTSEVLTGHFSTIEMGIDEHLDWARKEKFIP